MAAVHGDRDGLHARPAGVRRAVRRQCTVGRELGSDDQLRQRKLARTGARRHARGSPTSTRPRRTTSSSRSRARARRATSTASASTIRRLRALTACPTSRTARFGCPPTTRHQPTTSRCSVSWCRTRPGRLCVAQFKQPAAAVAGLEPDHRLGFRFHSRPAGVRRAVRRRIDDGFGLGSDYRLR